MICMKWPVCQRSCRDWPTRRCDGRLQAQSTPLASALALVSSCLAPHIEYHPSLPLPPWDKLRTSSSSAACPGAHHLLRPVLALPRFLGRGGQIDTRRGLVFRELVEPTRHMAPCFVCRRRPRGPVFRDLDARSGNARTDCGVGPGWLGRLGLASERGERTTGPPGSCARVLSRRGLIRFASFRQTRGLVGLVALRCVARLDGGNLDVIARRQPKSRVPFPPSDAFPTRAKPP